VAALRDGWMAATPAGELSLQALQADAQTGLVALRPARRGAIRAERLVYARELPASGDAVEAIGASAAGGIAFAFGHVVGHDAKFLHVAFTRQDSMAGFAGGPVLNRAGHVVGIIRSGARSEAARSIHRCVRADAAVRFLRALAPE
jgi:hypothetical protein